MWGNFPLLKRPRRLLLMNTFDKPIPPGEPLPHRKIIREWLIPLAERTTVYAIGLMLMDFAIWALLLAGTVLLDAPVSYTHLTLPTTSRV